MVIKTERRKLNKTQIGFLLRSYKQKLTSEGIPVKQILLFGSYAKGTENIDSDIDVAVIVSSKQKQLVSKNMNEITWLAKQVNVKLEPHVITTNDLDNPYISIVAEIKKHGVAY